MHLRPRPLVKACATVAVLAAAAGVADAKITAPTSTTYTGTTGAGRTLSLRVDSKSSIGLVAFQFPCRGDVTGATALQDLKLTKGKQGYRFRIFIYGGVSYSDEKNYDNAQVNIAGNFNRTGRRVTGTLRVETPRCGRTGTLKWSAKR